MVVSNKAIGCVRVVGTHQKAKHLRQDYLGCNVESGHGIELGTEVDIFPADVEAMTQREWEDTIEPDVRYLHNVLHCQQGGPWECSRCRADLIHAMEAIGLQPDASDLPPEPLCLHEEATWDDGSWSMRRPGDETVYRAAPGGPCPFGCGGYLPPAPRKAPEDMSAEECEAELEAAGCEVYLHKNAANWAKSAVILDGEVLHQGRFWRVPVLQLRDAVCALRKQEVASDE